MVICICGKELVRLSINHMKCRQHLEDIGLIYKEKKKIKCSCGHSYYSITVTHLKSKLHLNNGVRKKRIIYLVASDNDKNFIPQLDGIDYIERTN